MDACDSILPATLPPRPAAPETPLSGHRGLVFLLASAAGCTGSARRRVRGRRRHPRAGAWPADLRRGLHPMPDRLAAAWRRAGRRGAGVGRDYPALPQRAARHPPSCGAETGAVWRARPRAGVSACGRGAGIDRFGHGPRFGLFRDDSRRAPAPAAAWRCPAPCCRERSGPGRRAEPGRRRRPCRARDRPAADRADPGIGGGYPPFFTAADAGGERPLPWPSSRVCCATRACSMRWPRSDACESAASRSSSSWPVRPTPTIAGSLSAASLSALAAEPGITWLGAVADVRSVWRRAAIAVLAVDLR